MVNGFIFSCRDQNIVYVKLSQCGDLSAKCSGHQRRGEGGMCNCVVLV